MEAVLSKLNEIQKEQHASRIESMKLKMEIKDDIHKMDSRMVKVEMQWKLAIPFLSAVFAIITTFIKAKFTGKS